MWDLKFTSDSTYCSHFGVISWHYWNVSSLDSGHVTRVTLGNMLTQRFRDLKKENTESMYDG